MPSFPKEPFSYEASAKVLRLGEVPVAEKLTTCNKLLELGDTLSPPPYTLVLNHILFVLKPQPPSAAFTQHLPAYWSLLVRTLKVAKTEIHSLQARPNDLLPAAIAHLASADITVLQPVADALLYLASSAKARPLSQSLDLHASLLATVAGLLPKHPALHPLAVWTLEAHSRLQQRSRDPRAVLSTASEKLMFPLLRAPSNLKPAVEALLANAIFKVPTLSRQPLLQHIRDSTDPKLPEVAEFLFRTCVRIARSAEVNTDEQVAKGQKRGSGSQGSLARDVLRVLQFLDELIATLQDAVLDSGQAHPSLTIKLATLARVFEVAKEVDAYRPSYDVLAGSISSKRPRTVGKQGESIETRRDTTTRQNLGDLCIGRRVCELFKKLVALLRNFYTEHTSSSEAVQELSHVIQAILAFSLDVVEDSVSDVLVTIVQGRNGNGNTEAKFDLLSSRQGIFAALVQSHQETRALPLFFKRLTSSSMGFRLLRDLSPIICGGKMKRALAEAAESLPLAQPQQCIQALMGNQTELSAESLPCVFFMISVVVETANAADFQGVRKVVQNNVIARIPKTACFEHTRSASLFLLSSLMFSLARMGVALVSPELMDVSLNRDLLQACGVSEHASQDTLLGLPGKLFTSFSKQEPREDPIELLCLIRAMAMSCHLMVIGKLSEESKGLLQKLIYLVFDYFAELVQRTASGQQWAGALLFYDASPVDTSVSYVASLVPLLDFCAKGQALPNGFDRFLGYVAQRFDGINKFWEDILECSVVHDRLAEALTSWLSMHVSETEQSGLKCQSRGCNAVTVFRLLEALPRSYLRKGGERALRKRICELEGSICCREARVEAAEMLLRLQRHSFSSVGIFVRSVASELSSEHVLKLIGEKVLQGTWSVAEGESLMMAVVYEHKKRGYPEGVSFLVGNICAALEGGDLIEALGEDILEGMRTYLVTTLQECVATLEGDGDAIYNSSGVLGITERVLRLRSGATEWTLSDKKKREVMDALVEDVDAYLKRVFEKLVGVAMDMVCSKGCSGGNEHDALAGRRFLVQLCQGKTIGYRICQAPAAGSFATSRMGALSLHLLRSSDAWERSTGVEMLCGIGSNEDAESVEQLGQAILRELKDWDGWSQGALGTSLSAESAKQMVQEFQVMRGKILSGACMLCGWETEAEQPAVEWSSSPSGAKQFVKFTDARQRRDVSRLRAKRAVSGAVACALLQTASTMSGRLEAVYTLPSHEAWVHAGAISKLHTIWDESLARCMDAVETTASRKAPHRLDATHVQHVLTLLSPLVRHCAAQDGVGRVCRALALQHGAARWPAARVLRGALLAKGAGGMGTGVGEAYAALGACARAGVVRRALADVCEAAGRGCGGAREDGGRGVVAVVGRLVGAAGEDGVGQVGRGLDGVAREVLRVGREVYGEEVRYRGK